MVGVVRNELGLSPRRRGAIAGHLVGWTVRSGDRRGVGRARCPACRGRVGAGTLLGRTDRLYRPGCGRGHRTIPRSHTAGRTGCRRGPRDRDAPAPEPRGASTTRNHQRRGSARTTSCALSVWPSQHPARGFERCPVGRRRVKPSGLGAESCCTGWHWCSSVMSAPSVVGCARHLRATGQPWLIESTGSSVIAVRRDRQGVVAGQLFRGLGRAPRKSVACVMGCWCWCWWCCPPRFWCCPVCTESVIVSVLD